MKKKLFYILLFIIPAVVLQAQQEPQYSQYMFNMMAVNPAYTGTREALNALLLSRWQWVGLDGAPQSTSFALHTPVRDKRIGLGGSVVADKIGPVTNTFININYAHRIKLTEKLSLSLGLNGGITNYYVGISDLVVNDYDQLLQQDYDKSFQPNFGAGAYLYSDKYYFGFSCPRILNTKLTEGQTDMTSELERHYFTTLGYVFDIDTKWKLKPSVLHKMVENAPSSFDLTLQALYNERFWFGATYRINDAVVFLTEFQVNRQLVIGYSYDYTLSDISHDANGSHEILISYDFAAFKNEKVRSPRYF